LFLFNSDRVFRIILKPLTQSIVLRANEIEINIYYQDDVLSMSVILVSVDNLVLLHNLIKQDTYTLDDIILIVFIFDRPLIWYIKKVVQVY